MLAERKGIAIGQASAKGPAFIAVLGKEGKIRPEELEVVRDGTSKEMEVAKIELAHHTVYGKEMPGKTLAGPVAQLRLHHPVLPLHVVQTWPVP